MVARSWGKDDCEIGGAVTMGSDCELNSKKILTCIICNEEVVEERLNEHMQSEHRPEIKWGYKKIEENKMRRSKRKQAEEDLEKNKKKWEELKPEFNHWVCTSAGSDRYGHRIEWVSDDDQELKTEDGLHLVLNVWYIWVEFKNQRQISPDGTGFYLWGDTNPEYRDPSF